MTLVPIFMGVVEILQAVNSTEKVSENHRS